MDGQRRRPEERSQYGKRQVVHQLHHVARERGLISNFTHYANGITGSVEFVGKYMKTAPEIVMPDDAPAPDFVQPCPHEVTDLCNRIWTTLKQ